MPIIQGVTACYIWVLIVNGQKFIRIVEQTRICNFKFLNASNAFKCTECIVIKLKTNQQLQFGGKNHNIFNQDKI